ncbi:hypothetical protein M2475_000073 [Breznakia sp. PF5-3]|uniref:SpaA isopeptide-forming pilin-related protein n=1 Tax=unclassified Breznakia TaxID=2623764 RepID=UPI002406CB1E|nr:MULTISPECIES: SpaA isopeptide-forming pilin-related protein [unclassified Breznakia]MDF9823726.1 hypothetical protein [Breznakia sp. PM6-1]MDF9834524.1 hypothetical protein [Breznakia sp. PF5-3]MDF9837505.1 hypothetical protein [Breznakia sp. PFB2-8]MDF9859082.1 hypothetical protein [Breznakia sp. PH5-24]
MDRIYKLFYKGLIFIFALGIVVGHTDVAKVSAESKYTLSVDYSISNEYTTSTAEMNYDGGSYRYIEIVDSNNNKHASIPGITKLKDSKGAEELTYCIEPTKLTANSKPYDPLSTDDFNVVLSTADKLKLQEISYFGYGYNGDTSNLAYYATQLAIWDYQGYTFSGVTSNVIGKMNEIKKRVNDYETALKPSFKGSQVIVNGYGKSNGTLLKDTNLVFNNWFLSKSTGNYVFERNGNDILVYAQKDSSALTGTVTFQDIDPIIETSRGIDIIYKDPTNANTQALMKISGLDFSKFDISIRMAKGTVQVDKMEIGGSQEVLGAYLEVIEADTNIVVDSWLSDGTTHIINNVVAGDYILRERYAPDGYVTAQDIPFSITYDGQVQSLKMEDDFTKIEIFKYSKRNNTLTTDFVAGAKLEIIDKDTQEVVHTFTTTKKATRIDKTLVANKTYILREVEAPKGYKKADDIEFTVKNTGSVQKVMMYDQMMIAASKAGVAAGDTTNVMGYNVLFIGSLGIILCTYYRRKKSTD